MLIIGVKIYVIPNVLHVQEVQKHNAHLVILDIIFMEQDVVIMLAIIVMDIIVIIAYHAKILCIYMEHRVYLIVLLHLQIHITIQDLEPQEELV